MEKKLLTVKEVCTLLNVTRNRIYSLVFYKQIPHIKLNSSLRFDSIKINEWLENQSVEENLEKKET